MSFTNFCCRSGGNNMNGGGQSDNGEPGTSAKYTSTNGNWNGTSIFTPTDSSTPASSISVGDWACACVDGATTPSYYARVTAVAAGVNGAITLSTTRFMGTAPTSSASARTIRVGGAWLGPNAAVGFPFGMMSAALMDGTNLTPRVNFKNDQTYAVTTTTLLVTASNLYVRYEGYTTTFGDGGQANLDGGTTGASYILINASNAGAENEFINFTFSNNGATGSADGVSATTGGNAIRLRFEHCVFHDLRGSGFSSVSGTGGFHLFCECEFYNCNQSNSATKGGADIGGLVSVTWFKRTIFHDNSGSNTAGINAVCAVSCEGCIFDTNGGIGIRVNTNGGGVYLSQCDFYANASDGIGGPLAGGGTRVFAENCNFVDNGGYGVNLAAGATWQGCLRNCGFGSGTMANASGNTNAPTSGTLENISPITYGANLTPWVDPANGDFRLNSTATAGASARGAGRGSYTQTATSYAGTVSYPDVGQQHQDAGGGTGGVNRSLLPSGVSALG